MAARETIAIETRDDAAPASTSGGSWLEQFQLTARQSKSILEKIRDRYEETVRILSGVLNARNLRRQSLLYHKPFFDDDARIEGRLVVEEHHLSCGKPWCLGRDQFDYLISRGLKPEHKVLDFGCGSLRVGIWLIGYLEEGRYFGIDPHHKSLEGAVMYEIPLHGLATKRPRLLWDGDFSCEYFGESFDLILAFSVFNWLGKERTGEALERLCNTLTRDGRIVVYGDLPLTDAELRERFRLKVDRREAPESKFFRELNDFTELVWISEFG